MVVNESILDTISLSMGINMAGCPRDNERAMLPFDMELIAAINSGLLILSQLGVLYSPYTIKGHENKWEELGLDDDTLQMVKSYLIYRTRMAFDPPSSSTVFEALKNCIMELEWRLREEGARMVESKWNSI